MEERACFNVNNDREKFIELSIRLCKMAASAGYEIIPFSHSSTPYFSSLENHKKKQVVDSLKIFIEICQDVVSAGKSLTDTPSLTWHGLKKLELRFRSDMFGYIKDYNIIEVYDRSNIQIFRNFNFFEVVSYTLEEVFCRPWTELFIRENPEQSQKILDVADKYYSRESSAIVCLEDVGVHRIRENGSPFNLKVNLMVNYMAPVYDENGVPAGFVAVETGELASPIPKGQDAQMMLNNYFSKINSSLES